MTDLQVRHGFERNDTGGVTFFYDARIHGGGRIAHGFFARAGGVSEPPYKSLNMGISRPDDIGRVRENQLRGARALGMDYNQLILVNYQHGTGVQPVTHEHAGNGITKPQQLPGCDGLITNQAGLPLMTLHADCLPVFFYNPKTGAIGLCHAGWRGVDARLPLKMAQRMVREYGGSARDIIAGVGPGIGACCFEVGPEVAERFEAHFPDGVVRHEQDKYFADLPRAVALQLLYGGLEPRNITLSDLCTYCREDLFFSYRRDKGQTGAMGAMIMKYT